VGSGVELSAAEEGFDSVSGTGGGFTVGGIVEGAVTRSVTGAARDDRSLNPTRNPREKKTPQTATPARNTKISCRAESPLSSCPFLSAMALL
jgi:hypothetical protein